MSDYYIHETAIVEDGVSIGEGSKIWHWVHVITGAEIGNSCVLGQNVFVGAKAKLGNNVRVQNNVSIYDEVILEDDTFCGPSMVFTNVINPRSAIIRKAKYSKTHVGKGVSIGANATIVCGNDIGEYAFVGAGAVVTKYIKPYALVLGNPARQIGWMSRNGQRLVFKEDDYAKCSESHDWYKINECRVEFIGKIKEI